MSKGKFLFIAWIVGMMILTPQLGAEGLPGVAGKTTRPSSTDRVALVPSKADGRWLEVDFLNDGRRLHTATLLPSGKVLVVGGKREGVFFKSAELFDPATGRWSETGSLNTERARHTATLLPSGKVLVVGGESEIEMAGVGRFPGSIDTVELYDPTTGAWEQVASLAEGRMQHTATLLRDGRVLIVGGTHLPGDVAARALASTEIYDPETGSWDRAMPLVTQRWDHAAILLPSGEVLISGGVNIPDQTLVSAEIYDPFTGRWSTTGSLAAAREEHTTTLLSSGRVLAVGGRAATPDESELFQRQVELYDPETGQWSLTAPLNSARSRHTATLLVSGEVLVTAGGSPGASSSAELYDPSASTWRRIDRLETARRSHTATLLPSGAVLVTGGQAVPNGTPSVELYEPVAGSWSTIEPPSRSRIGATATLLPTGQVLFAGGDASSFPINSEVFEDPAALLIVLSASDRADLYDPSTRTWSALPPLVTARAAHTATLLPSGDVLVTGGGGPERRSLRSGEIFDAEAGTWRPTPDLAIPRLRHTATLLPTGHVLIAGGINEEAFPGGNTPGQALAGAELYDPVSDRWSITEPLGDGRVGHTATLLPSGEVLVVGGWSANRFLTSAELYDPISATWSLTTSPSRARFFHTATLLPSGKVLIAGGRPEASPELYDPATALWTTAGDLVLPRFFHAATLLQDGRVLLSGGVSSSGESVEFFADTELFDPLTNRWKAGELLADDRAAHTSILLPDGDVLAVGGRDQFMITESAELYRPRALGNRPRPEILETSPTIRHGDSFTVTGTGFRGDSEASGGGHRSSAVDFPLLQLRSLTDGQLLWLTPSDRTELSDGTTRLTVDRLPAPLTPGWHLVTVFVAGIPSQAHFVEATCGLVIDRHPERQIVPIGSPATFSVEARGARRYQWKKDGIDIPGATGPTYTTPPVVAADSGAIFEVVVDGGCEQKRSNRTRLVIADDDPPDARVVSPSGGEFWLLSETGEPPREQVVTWEMSDNVRVCQLRASLLFSNDGGQTYEEGPAITLGPGGTCSHPGETRKSLTYQVPTSPPSGQVGSLYKVRLRVTDQAGLETVKTSENPFFIVRPNEDAVETLILTHFDRMVVKGVLPQDRREALADRLEELAGHPRVNGRVLDLGGVTTLETLYDAWDENLASDHLASVEAANDVLFAPGGLHDHLRNLLDVFTGAENVILVGDDRIIPMARLPDRTVLFPESNYASDDPADTDAGLTASGTTVGRALAADRYLSDDPLAVRDRIRTEELDDENTLFLPDLAVGRLVETPEEITMTVATFLSQDGILDLAERDPEGDHRVMVSAYDFLVDSGKNIRRRWKNAFGLPEPHDDAALAPVNGSLIGGDWGESSVDGRRLLLREHLAGLGGAPYGLVHPSGHATHFELGVPGIDRFDIQGLPAEEIAALTLEGSVIYAVGCHGGLPVAGSESPADHPDDLPQSVLNAGAGAYIANSGYGWGLLNGVGLSERLVEIFTEEITRGGTLKVGHLVRRSKERYFLEAARFDDYDAKTLMQWTLFGLPMYAVRTGVVADEKAISGVARASFSGPAPEASELPAMEVRDGVRIERRLSEDVSSDGLELPPFLTRLEQRFTFTADGVYRKFDASGELLDADIEGCPEPDPGEAKGCYYRLNGLASGSADLPIQPLFVFDSRLSGTRQHGVLWMGGTYEEEGDWVPLVAELVTNGGDGSNHGSTPRTVHPPPRGPQGRGRRRPLGGDGGCPVSDADPSSVVFTTGEAVKADPEDETFSLLRLHRTVDLEVFYFNDRDDPANNCDIDGPVFGAGPHHAVRGTSVEWAVPVTDASDVWRVIALVTDERLDGTGVGRWTPIELADAGDGTFRGELRLDGAARLTYFLQAVDRRGNVSWLLFDGTDEPASGVEQGIPLPVEVAVEPGAADLAIAVATEPEPVAPGGRFLDTVSVTNLGPDPASGLEVRTTMPPAMSYVFGGGEGWSCGADRREIFCTREELEVGSAPDLTLILLAPPEETSLTRQIEVTATEDDPVSANDAVTVTTRVDR